jgi:aspartate carbamoyltransferase catalytic subunit
VKHLLGIEHLSREEIERILETSEAMLEISQREVKRVPTLRGRTVINVFLESSTRTRVSFEIAAKRLSADAINVSAPGSSLSKSETLNDMARNLAAMNADVLVVRDSTAGVPQMLAARVRVPVVNAGDGCHEHPTQALLDVFTARQSLGTLDGRVVAIVGDISHSRVARSDIYAFTKLGAEVRVAGPPTMIPVGVEALGVKPCFSMAEALEGADVIAMLRIQQERIEGALFPSVREYSQTFGLDRRKLGLAKPGAIVLHPGPINRGVEIAPDVADNEPSRILDQVTNGVAVRMAVLYLLTGGEP